MFPNTRHRVHTCVTTDVKTIFLPSGIFQKSICWRYNNDVVLKLNVFAKNHVNDDNDIFLDIFDARFRFFFYSASYCLHFTPVIVVIFFTLYIYNIHEYNIEYIVLLLIRQTVESVKL